MQDGQPGQVVSPNSQPDTPNWQYNPDNLPAPVQHTPAEVPSQQPADAPAPQPPQSSQLAQAADQDSISWTASEFIAHHKPGGWYGLLALAGIAIAAGVYFLTKDAISAGVILI